MTAADTDLRFNALTDPWLPLLGSDGTTQWASPVEVLCAEKTGVDLDYPRDDFRVYGRLLLSALLQALFPAKDKAELLDRLEMPLTRSAIEAKIAPVLKDFDLFGPRPFLQIVPDAAAAKSGGAAPFVFAAADLFQPSVRVDAVSLPIALVTLFIEQAYAGGAGRGYGAGPGGQPGALTLIEAGDVRRSAWANTLTVEGAARLYAKDPKSPWSNAKVVAKSRAETGLVEGLFFQPRGAWLVPAGTGVCSFTGRTAELVRLSPLVGKSSARPASSDNDLWQHPCSPLAVNSVRIAPIRLNAQRPAWTGLAQLLAPISKDPRRTHPRAGTAPVLAQWRTLGRASKRLRLLVLDFDRDKANIRRRFFEAYSILDDFVGKSDVVERLRALSDDAQTVQRALDKALTRAHDDRKGGGFAAADATAKFWSETERFFGAWLDAVVAIDGESDEGWERAQAVQRDMEQTLRRAAVAIFDTHAALSEFDPRKQERIAKARRGLRSALWPKPKTTEVRA